MRAGLLHWQWSDDAAKHRRRTFARFVLSGGWSRNLRAARPA